MSEGVVEAGASAYCTKGAPLRELERAIGGAGDPLLRLAQGLARSAASDKGELVARELARLAGAAFAAVFVTEVEVELALAGAAGPAPADWRATAQRIALRALRGSRLVRADDRELAELSRLGSPCSEALAVPLVAGGEPLGALVVATAWEAELDPEHVSSIA